MKQGLPPVPRPLLSKTKPRLLVENFRLNLILVLPLALLMTAPQVVANPTRRPRCSRLPVKCRLASKNCVSKPAKETMSRWFPATRRGASVVVGVLKMLTKTQAMFVNFQQVLILGMAVMLE